MAIANKVFYLGFGIFFLWLAIYIPQIPELMFIDLSNLSENQLILLRYASLTGYLGAMIGVATE